MKLTIAASARLGSSGARARLSPFLRSVASRIAPRDARVAVNWIGERTMTRLNRVYKKRAGAAEILTFPCFGAPDPGGEAPLGEIYLCWTRLVRGARLRGVSPRVYGARLVVHGLFHLRGYRHDGSLSAGLMEAAEARILKRHLSEREVKRLFA
ncbi:MAG: rRNA maturation RNase YbeY [Candidatus Krumholzibacteriia bacterium]